MQTLPERRIRKTRRAHGQSGFTLLELLVVIAVLGVLSGVVVFSMGTMTDQAQESACATDERTLATALEAYAATTGSYGDQDALVAAGYLSSASISHDVVLSGDSYSIVATGDCATGSSDEVGVLSQEEVIRARDKAALESKQDEKAKEEAEKKAEEEAKAKEKAEKEAAKKAEEEAKAEEKAKEKAAEEAKRKAEEERPTIRRDRGNRVFGL